MNSAISIAPKRAARRCPRFDSCNAPICPLDDWRRAQHLHGERICLWLREAVKPGGMARIAHAATDEIAATVAEALPAIMASSSADLRHKLAEACLSGSKLANMRAAREGMGHAAGVSRAPVSTSAAAHAVLRTGGIGDDHGRR